MKCPNCNRTLLNPLYRPRGSGMNERLVYICEGCKRETPVSAYEFIKEGNHMPLPRPKWGKGKIYKPGES